MTDTNENHWGCEFVNVNMCYCIDMNGNHWGQTCTIMCKRNSFSVHIPNTNGSNNQGHVQ